MGDNIKLCKEKQYDIQFKILEDLGAVNLGPTTSYLWRNDPRHLCFLLARYKFCSKLLAGKKNVLEIGCGEGFGLRTVLQTVERIHGIDFDPLFIEWAKKQYSKENLKCSFSVLDIIKEKPNKGPYDGVYALDFIEHIHSDMEHKIMVNICEVLSEHAVCIIGTPNINAHNYASQESITGHINLKNAETLKKLLENYFHNVFIFSMNDEVVHTGFYPMANYLIGIGIEQKCMKKLI